VIGAKNMISIKALLLSDIGRRVEYHGGAGEKELGIIKSWNDQVIFVVYPGKNYSKAEHFKEYTAAATKPEDLFFI
jgi:hypothetical protein